MNVRGVPARIVIFGDAGQASTVLPLAQKLAERLWDNHRHFVKQRILGPSGEKISAEVNRAAGFVRLTIESSGNMVGGLAYVKDAPFPLHYDEATKKFGFHVAYPRRHQGGAETFGPWADEPRLVGCFRESQGSLRDSRKDLDPFGYAYSIGSSDVSLLGSPLYRTPGKYSGEMRKVVQALIGSGSPVPFDYRFYTTHGIMTCSDGSKWVIEVSNTKGVRAAKLPKGTARGGSTSQGNASFLNEITADMGYYPVYQPLDKLFSPERTVQLAPLSAIAEVYRTPYASNIGWAFSYSGREAQLTCYEEVGAVNPYNIGYRYKLSFSEHVDPTTGKIAPATAALALVESGYLWGDRVIHFKIWEELENSVISFDLYKGQHTAPVAGAMDMAFHVYYEGDQEVVCRYSNPNQASNPVTPSSDPIPVIPNDPLGPPVYAAGTYRSEGWRNETAPRSVYCTPNIAAIMTPDIAAGNTKLLKLKYGTIQGPIIRHFGSEGADTMFETGVSATSTEYQGGTTAQAIQTVIIIPEGEREGFYYYRLDIDQIAASIQRNVYEEGGTGRNVVMDGSYTSGPRKVSSVNPPRADYDMYSIEYIAASAVFSVQIGATLYSDPLPNWPSKGGSDSGFGASSPAELNTREALRFFGSMTRDKQLFSEVQVTAEPTVYQAFIDGGSATQHMYSVPDAFGNYAYASAVVEGVTGEGLAPIKPVGSYDYAATLANSAFFYGKP